MHQNKTKSPLFTLSAITIGGMLEWFEIGLFIFWPLLVQGDTSMNVSVAESLNALVVFTLAVIAVMNGAARALGGWYFGKKGDTQGRKNAFPLTILFSTLPSWSLAILA